MAKIGTAQIEIKPVLSEEALTAICQRIEDAVANGVQRGMTRGSDVKIDGKVIARVVAAETKRRRSL